MTKHIRYSRRVFVKSVMGALVVGPSVFAAGCGTNDTVDRKLQIGTLRAAMDEAERLAGVAGPEPDAIWSLSQTLVHCAQSIEYSLAGFPEMKSKIFQQTAGAAAFSLFAWRGQMSHNLAEPIPGAPSLIDENDIAMSLERLRKSIDSFQLAEEPLQPHFAFGALGKSDYELAHAMHLANHFSAFPA
jgi:hypothetical protein